jgi:hypothetical protein
MNQALYAHMNNKRKMKKKDMVKDYYRQNKTDHELIIVSDERCSIIVYIFDTYLKFSIIKG